MRFACDQERREAVPRLLAGEFQRSPIGSPALRLAERRFAGRHVSAGEGKRFLVLGDLNLEVHQVADSEANLGHRQIVLPRAAETLVE